MAELPKVNVIEGALACIGAFWVGFFLAAAIWAHDKPEPEPHEQQNQRLADAITMGVSRAAEEASYRKTLDYYMGTDTGWLDRELGIRP